MTYFGYSTDRGLKHHGVKGQKWGVRRYVNYDGTLTPQGKAKYKDSQSFRKAVDGYQKAGNAYRSRLNEETNADPQDRKATVSRKKAAKNLKKAEDKLANVLIRDLEKQKNVDVDRYLQKIVEDYGASTAMTKRERKALSKRSVQRLSQTSKLDLYEIAEKKKKGTTKHG